MENTLTLQVGDIVKTKLIHHECNICKGYHKVKNPYYHKWIVESVGHYINLIHYHKVGKSGTWATTGTVIGPTIKWFSRARFDIDGKGLGSHLNHQIYKINDEYI
jgi:hypothetical protein